MSMPVGFTYYWDYDREILLKHTDIWVDWLRERIRRHALYGLEEMLRRMDHREVGWVLLFAQGVFGAVEGISSFAFRRGDNSREFIEFCNELLLPKPCPWPGLAEAMYAKFRCGLAHGFGIEKGGLTFKEDLGATDPVTRIDDCFWLDPRWLLERLQVSLDEFSTRAARAGSQEAADFDARFREILDQTCLQPPRKLI